ncbi:MAG: hypothetical protein JWO94_656 [Verrucomicrobiaceae bacterium]|nr:hypothetical protein [Verrucomicrobiaceae bacterium]
MSASSVKSTLVFLFLLSVMAPWAALQTIAWASMAARYSVQAGSLREGLEQTFDGAHPCTLCEAVQGARQRDAAALQGAPWRLLVIAGTGAFVLGGAWMFRRSGAHKRHLKKTAPSVLCSISKGCAFRALKNSEM